MSQIDIYVFLLCLIVFAVLTIVSIFVILTVLKMQVKLIQNGVEDNEILTEYQKSKTKKRGILSKIISCVLCLLFLCVIGFTVFANVSTKISSDKIPSMSVVKSASMAKKNPKNKYLFENDINNQFNTHDLILTYRLPDEFDLKLYDIVVYEVDGIRLVHRIVAIEEPNEKHPNQRYFLCQGDAVDAPDKFPVTYNQMKAIYKNQKIVFVGSFVSFLQSPAGWLCLLLLTIAIITTPIIEKKLQKEKNLRLELLLTTTSEPKQKLPLVERIKNLDEKQTKIYQTIVEKLEKIGATKTASKEYFTYKIDNLPIARLTETNGCLVIFIALSPNANHIYKGAVYDAKHSNYPLKIKLDTTTQARWACQLLSSDFKAKVKQ